MRRLFKTLLCLLAALFVGGALVISHRALAAGESKSSTAPASRHPDLEYLKAINSVAPPRDPELLFLLMAGDSNLNLQGEGVGFFSAPLTEFDAALPPAQKSFYWTPIGFLRPQPASSVSLLQRIGYVKETFAILDQARQISGGEFFVVNWISGIVRAELPRQFDQTKPAEAELA